MANDRQAPLIDTGRDAPLQHTGVVRPLVYDGTAVAGVTADSNHVAWISHPGNAATQATLTVTSANSVYPAANLQVLPITAVWRSTSTGAQEIALDFGAAQSVDILGLVNHNLSSTATIDIVAGSTLSYSDLTTTMTWRQFTAFKVLASVYTLRYWKITITDASNTNGFFEVGYLVTGLMQKPGFTFRQGWITGPSFNFSRVETEFGTPHCEELSRRQRLAMDFGPLLPAEMSLLTDLYRSVKRNVHPLLIVPVRGSTDAYFGRIQNVLEDKVDFRHYATVQFVEDSYGHALGV